MQHREQAKKSISLLMEAMRPFWRAFCCLLGLLVLSAAMESVGLALVPTVLTVLMSESSASDIPKIFASTIHGLPQNALALLITTCVAVLYVLKNIVSIVTIGYSTSLVNQIRDSWRLKIISRYLKSPLGETRSKPSGKLIENLVNQPIRAAKLMRFIIGMCADIILSTAMIAVLIMTSWKVTIVVGGIFIVVALVGSIPLKNIAGRLGVRENKMLGQLTHAATETLNGLQQIKVFGLENQWREQFMSVSRGQSNLALRSSLLSETPNLIGSFALAAMIVAVVAYSVDETRSSLTLLVLFVLVGQRLHGAVSGLMRNYTNIRNLIPSFKLVYDLSMWDPVTANFSEKFRGPLNLIEVDHVCFTYDGRRELLHDVSFKIERGNVAALIGPSGVGKSTLVNLICGLMQPSSGEVLIDGVSLSQIEPSSWLNRISIVSQDNFLFHGSIRENLLIGNPLADEQSLERALREAAAYEFISHLPNGLDTIVGERGASLSGGQVQRLAIARALLRDGDLFIFDEATSALDENTQAQVLKTIHNLAKSGKIVLLISHRKEALLIADHQVSIVKH